MLLRATDVSQAKLVSIFIQTLLYGRPRSSVEGCEHRSLHSVIRSVHRRLYPDGMGAALQTPRPNSAEGSHALDFVHDVHGGHNGESALDALDAVC